MAAEGVGRDRADIDISTDHREQVLRYVYDKYGEERTGMVANVVTYRPRMAIRQVGAAMGFPLKWWMTERSGPMTRARPPLAGATGVGVNTGMPDDLVDDMILSSLRAAGRPLMLSEIRAAVAADSRSAGVRAFAVSVGMSLERVIAAGHVTTCNTSFRAGASPAFTTARAYVACVAPGMPAGTPPGR